jgi:hypothetical protein
MPGRFTMNCICGHGERDHPTPSPYGCHCGCTRFRWDWLDWNSRPLKLWNKVDRRAVA